MLDGLAIKLDRAKRGAQSYVHDRVQQTRATVISYGVAAGLFAAAGIFLIVALLVVATAAFRYVELHYGLFEAFGALSGLLALMAVLCAVMAVHRLKRSVRRVVPLASRLRVAINAPLSNSDVAGAAAMWARPSQSQGLIMPALIVASLLVGCALAHRRTPR